MRANKDGLFVGALAFFLVTVLGLLVAVTPTCAGEAEEYFAKRSFKEGIAHAKKGEYDAALTSFEEAVLLKPNYALAHYNLGIAYLIKGNREKALKEHKILEELDPYLAKKLLEMINKD